MPKATRILDAFEKRLRALEKIKVSSGSFNTSQIDKAAIAAQRLQQQQQKLSIQAQELANRQERARQAAERLARSQQNLANQTARAQQGLGKNADAHVRAFKALETGAKKAKAEVDKINAQTARQAQQQLRIQEQAARSLARVQQNAAKQGADAFIDSLNKSGNAAARLNTLLNRVGSTLQRIGSGLASFGRTLSVALTVPLAALGAISIKSAKDLDAQVNTLKAFTGSAEAAEARLKELINTARQTPGLTTSLALLIDSQLRLAQATVETIDKVTPAIGRLNAVQQFADPARFVQNLAQLVTQNFERPDLKELIGQSPIAGQIIAELFNVDSPINSEAIKAAAKKMGLTTVDAFFTAFADAAAKNPTLATVTESIGTRLAKQADRLTLALRPLGLAILDAIQPALDRLIPFIERLSAAFANLPKPAQQALIVIGGLAAILGPALVVIGSIVTSLGGLVTGLSAVAGVIGTIGLPALLAVIAGLVVVIGEWIAILTALGLAWKTNFLGIRGLVTDAANAVVTAFNRIRKVFEDATQRILPTLQSITTKVLGVVEAAWERYGKVVVQIVGDSFGFIIDVTETFLKLFTNFVDLVLKLIDGDWRGAWRAFARIVITQLDRVGPLFVRFANAFRKAFLSLNAFIIRQAVAFVNAALKLAADFVSALAVGLIAGFPKVQNALSTLLLLAVVGIPLGPIAQGLVARLIAELRRAAGDEDLPLPKIAGQPPIPGTTKPIKPKPKPAADLEDDKGLRRSLDKLREARDRLAEVQEKGQLELLKARIDSEFDVAKSGLDRESRALEASFEDRLTTVKRYFDERRRLQEDEIQAEIVKELQLSSVLFSELASRRRAAEREFRTEISEIEADPKLTGAAKTAAIQAAEIRKAAAAQEALNEFKLKHEESQKRVIELEKQQGAAIDDINRAEKQLTEELRKQEAQLSADLFEERGATADAAAIRLRQQFKETLKDLRIDITGLAPELQSALNSVNLQALKGRLEELPQPVRDLIELLEIAFNRALITEQTVKIDRGLAELRLQENEIQNKVLDGVISERDARAQIVGLQQIAKARLLDILAAQIAIAKETPGQEDEVLRLQGQIQEIQRLGREIDEIAVRINQQVFADLESGFANVFSSFRKGIDGVKDAVIGLGESILDTFNRILAESFVEKIFGPLLKPGAENTEGTLGGVFSKLFGLKPKVADSATLATAATTAGAALTTGGTVAATALTTGAAASSTTWLSSVTASATAFASSVVAAGAAFAAATAAAAGAQSIGGLGSAFGGAAKGDFLAAQPGGQIINVAEGGFPEAVLTTDPKHAARQFQILRQYLRETKGLFGRIPQHVIPRFEAGGFISPRQTEMDLLSSITRGPSPVSVLPHEALARAGGGITEQRLRFILTSEDMVENYLNSAQGEQVFAIKLERNRQLIHRLANRRN